MANATITVLEADGTTETDVVVLDVGRQAAAASKSVAASTEDKAVLDAMAASLALLDNSISSGNELQVDVVAALPAGTNALGTVKITNDAGTVIDPVAQVAHDAADSGAPIKVGSKSVSNLSGQTLVSANDRSDVKSGLDGALFVRNVPLGDIVSGKASNTDGTVTTVLAASGDAAIKTYLTKAILVNMHASTTAYVELYSGAVSMAYIPVPPGGCVVSFDPPLPPNAANETWRFDPSAAVTTLYCSMVGFKSKV